MAARLHVSSELVHEFKMASAERCYSYGGTKSIIIVAWKIKAGQWIGYNSVILSYRYADDRTTLQKLKSNTGGIVKHLQVNVADVIAPGITLFRYQACGHEVVMKDICAQCGSDLRQLDSDKLAKVSAATSVSMVHSVPELRVSHELAQQLGQADEARLLKLRKLVLLVDLDQTLIHTTNDNIPPNLKDVYHFQLYGSRSPWYHARLRPSTKHFLGVVSKHYELHICTFGARAYAHTIAQILDPDGKLFSHRILSRDECFNATSKTGNLKFLFPCGDSMVCIIDDREDVWNYAPNVVHVKPYHFFHNTGDINAPPGMEKTGESTVFPDDSQEVASKKQVKKPNSSPSTVSTTPKISSDCKDKVNGVETDENTLAVTNSDTENNRVTESAGTGDVESKPRDNSHQEETTDDDKCCANDDTKNEPDVDNSESTPPNTADHNKSSRTGSPQNLSVSEDENQDSNDAKSDPSVIDVVDDDDYLLYLEEILVTIHKAYYQMLDEMVGQDMKNIPDLKSVIPYVRKKVLKGVNIVFSGVIPTNMPPHRSRLWTIAKSLGANVQHDIVLGDEQNCTTHIIAAKLGTAKLNKAKKSKTIHVVSPEWLLCCSERWEHADERLFPLTKDTVFKNPFHKEQYEPPKKEITGKNSSLVSNGGDLGENNSYGEEGLGPHNLADVECYSESSSEAFSYSPMLAFSAKEIADMGKEVDTVCSESSNSDSLDSDASAHKKTDGCNRKRKNSDDESESSTAESLTGGECPKGWKKLKKNSPRKQKVRVGFGGIYESEDDTEVMKYPRCELPHDSDQSDIDLSDSDDFRDSIGSVDEEMAAALEREFADS